MKLEFFQLIELERIKLENFKDIEKNNATVWGNGKTVLEVLKIAKSKFSHMSDAELLDYKMSHGHCVKSKF